MKDASWLLDRAGTYLEVQAQLTDAKTLLEQALAIDEAAYGPDHPDVGTRLEQPGAESCGPWGSGPGRCRNGRWASPRRPTARITTSAPG